MRIRYLAMILASSFIGILSNPEFLAASDSILVSDLDRTNITETKISNIEFKIAESTPEVVAKTVIKAPVAGVAKVETEVVKNKIVFSWGEQNLKNVASTSVDSGKDVARVGKLLWAHENTSFNNIKKLKIGDTFSVIENGVAKKYKVAKNPINQTAGVKLQATKKSMYHESVGEIYINAMTDRGFGGHDLVLMTCDGNNSRFVVVADAF